MFKRRSFQTTVRLLCEGRREFYRSDGSMNIRKAALTMGLHQPTLLRILEGQSVNPHPNTADKLCRYFRVSYEQLIGAKPIPWIDQVATDVDKEKGAQELIEIYSAVSPGLREEILEFARFRAAVSPKPRKP